MNFPAPVIHVAIEPKTKSDQEKLGTAIQRLAEEDPTFQVRTDEETGQTIIAGMGELHLDVLVDRMRREFKVEANVGKPQVAYRETIRQDGREGRVHPQEADRWFRPVRQGASSTSSRPAATVDGGYEFVNTVTGGRIPREYIPSVDAGCQEAMEFGVARRLPAGRRQGHPAGRRSTTTSTPPSSRSRSPARWRSRRRPAGPDPVLMEPMMAVEVTTPEDYMGDVIGDLNSRRGQIQAMDERSGARVVTALVPLSEMFGYVGDLRSKTQGRASYSMQFDSYAEVPRNVAEEIIAKARGE